MIHAGLFDLPQSKETRHIPDGVLKRGDGYYAIEVELRQKKPADIYKKMHALLHAWDNETFGYLYAGIWYYTPDPHIQRALESARTAQGKHTDRAKLIEIYPLQSVIIDA